MVVGAVVGAVATSLVAPRLDPLPTIPPDSLIVLPFVGIAIGLLGDPRVLLLDEPSASLDPRQRERLWAFLAELGTTVVFSTHDVGEAERHADRLLVLADGELLFTGTPTELETATGGSATTSDFETAFVQFLHDRGH